MKIIAVTGTPGTGKTRLAGKLAQKLNAEVIDLSGIVNENKLYGGIDKARDTKIVDALELKKFIDNLIKKKFGNLENIIVEGLLSHLLSPTHIIVLRTNPKVLKKRLESRNYSKAKIRENLESEFMGVCLEESLRCENVIEIDTTEPGNFNKNLNSILEWLKKGGRSIKEIDWAVDFCEVLNEF